MITCLAGVLNTPLQAQRDWKILPLFHTNDFDCQLRYLEVAGPADTLWLEPIFINHTSKPQELGYWQINLSAYEEEKAGPDEKHKRALDFTENSAFLSQANKKLFICNYDRSMCIPPGDTLFAGRILSEYASAGLMDDELGNAQLPLEYPDRRLRATVSIFYNDFINKLSISTEGTLFYFRWNAIRASDLPTLAQRLENSLRAVDLSANFKLMSVLLSDPRIHRQIALETYNAALIGLDNPFNRQTLLRFLQREHPDNPVLRQYILKGIQKRELLALEFIRDGYWDDTLVEPLVATMDSTTFPTSVLQILNWHTDLWRNRGDLTGHLAQVVFSRYPELWLRDSLNMENVLAWDAAANALSMTLDSSAIFYFEGALLDSFQYKFYNRFDFDRTPPFFQATRVCDVAFEAICRLKGIDIQKRYYEASGLTTREIYQYLNDFDHPKSLNNKLFMDAIRDKLIARYLAEK